MTATQAAPAATTETLRLSRFFDAPRARVFRAFTDPEVLRRWWGPEGMNTPNPQVDLRVGGAYRLEMHTSDGLNHVIGGQYREIVTDEKLVFTWAWERGGTGGETLVTLEFRDRDGGTELSLTHEGFGDAESCEKHNRGWSSSLDCLDRDITGGQTS